VFKISAELPGIDAKDIDVSVSGDTRFVLYGSFQRSFQLPSTSTDDRVAADFSKGVLTITLPKTAEAQKSQKKIEIRSA
jgi:HSP20 family protein